MPERESIDTLLSRSERLVSALDDAVANIPDELLDRPSSRTRGSIRAWVHHLADTALVGAGRVRAMAADENPFFPAHDFAAWEVALCYESRPLALSLALYRISRESTQEILRGLPPGAWDRCGRHEAQGILTLRDLVVAQCEDAEGHIADILAERSTTDG